MRPLHLLQHPLAKEPNAARRTKQPRVASHPAHDKGVVVVHLAHTRLRWRSCRRGHQRFLTRCRLARSKETGGRDVCRLALNRRVPALPAIAVLRLRRHEAELTRQIEPRVHLIAHKRVEPRPAHARHHLAQGDESKVAVDRPLPRPTLQFGARDPSENSVAPQCHGQLQRLPRSPAFRRHQHPPGLMPEHIEKKRLPRRQPRSVRQQHAQSHLAFAARAKRRPKTRHPVVKPHFARVHEQKQRRQRGQHLGQRGQIKARRHLDRRPIQPANAAGAFVKTGFEPKNRRRRSGKSPRLDPLPQKPRQTRHLTHHRLLAAPLPAVPRLCRPPERPRLMPTPTTARARPLAATAPKNARPPRQRSPADP